METNKAHCCLQSGISASPLSPSCFDRRSVVSAEQLAILRFGIDRAQISRDEQQLGVQRDVDAAKVVKWNHSRGVVHALHPISEDRLDVDEEGFLQAFHAFLDVFYRISHRTRLYAAFSPHWLDNPRSPNREECAARSASAFALRKTE